MQKVEAWCGQAAVAVWPMIEAASFGPPGDDVLQGQIVLVRGLTEVGVEAVVADGQRVIVGAGLLILLLPDVAALDELASWGTAEDAVRGDHRVRAPDGFDRDVEIEGQGRDGTDALGGFDVGAGEFDAVRGQGPEHLIETDSS